MESFSRVLDDVPEDSGDEELLPSRENRGEMFKKPTRRARWGKNNQASKIEAFCNHSNNIHFKQYLFLTFQCGGRKF